VFRDILKFRRAPVAPRLDVLQKCACDPQPIIRALEEGRINAATCHYFVMLNPLCERPVFRSRLPPLQQQQPKRQKTVPKPRATRPGRIRGKPPKVVTVKIQKASSGARFNF
jgi:hypothetical protein